MQTHEIRKRFIDHFVKAGHTEVPSASLVLDDPNLLFVNAGMVPFKPYFLGHQTPEYDTATSIQKCVRTLDIEEVGITTRHNTFFQMAGNFSFGDYFKEGAIKHAWSLLTNPVADGGYGIDPGKLWATVYLDDDEAFEIWRDVVGLPEERIQRRGMADNYWSMGVPGPCGPCSEIFYDRGPDYGVEGGPVAAADGHHNPGVAVPRRPVRGQVHREFPALQRLVNEARKRVQPRPSPGASGVAPAQVLGDVDGVGLLDDIAPLGSTCRARVFDDRSPSSTPTTWAGAHDLTEQRLTDPTDLTGAIAVRAGDRFGPGCSTGRLADLTRNRGAHLDGNLCTEDGVDECDLCSDLEIRPRGRSAGSLLSTESTAEELAEDVAEAAASEPERVAATTVKAVEAVLVIAGTFLGVAEHLVRLGDRLEAGFGVGIVGVGVGVQFACLFAVSLFQFLWAAPGGDPQKLVIICCHVSLP